jgi:hypothetical protein
MKALHPRSEVDRTPPSKKSKKDRPPPFEFVAEYVRQLNHHCDYEDDELLVEEGEEKICGHTTTNLISVRDLIYEEAECEADAILGTTNINSYIIDDDDDDAPADDVDDYDKESTTPCLKSSVARHDCCCINDHFNNGDEVALLLDPQEAAISADVELIKRYCLLPRRRQQQQEHDIKNISNTPITICTQLFHL